MARRIREDNLLAIQPRAGVRTTDSSHPLEVYLNLAVRMKLTGINQLWVADIASIRLRTEFVYLAAVLDAWSRKVVGWALGRSLAEESNKRPQAGAADISGAASRSFFRHGEVYRWEKKPGDEPAEPNRFSSTGSPIEESPVGDSSAGCSPAEPASASPTIDYPQEEPTP